MEIAGPITERERIDSLDVLRGVAVLAILVMNIWAFSMIGAAYMNPTAYGDLTGANYWVWYLSHLLGDMKFMSIFSMLFGAGIIVMTSRREASGRGSVGLHYRRMLWLALFGLIHAHGLWYGDILFTYALCGMIAFWFRRLPPVWLIVIGVAVVGIASGFSVLTALFQSHIPEASRAEMAADWTPAQETIDEELAAYRGGWLDQAPHRSKTALFFQLMIFPIFIGPRAGGLMLIGMALFKLGVFSAKRSAAFYLGLIVAGAVVGVPLVHLGVRLNEQAGWSFEYSMFLGGQLNYWASIVVALGWVGVVMLVCKSVSLRTFTRPLAAAGRMALTCYLLETIICTTIFYGHGFGRFGHFDRVEQILTVLGVWVVLLVFAPLWLSVFRFGPFEWLWRSLTYLELQPLRRQRAP